MSDDEAVPCEACQGRGEWDAECCSGAGGCSCGGFPVPMGMCRVCGGQGERAPDADTRANIAAIKGLCYLGSGPTWRRS